MSRPPARRQWRAIGVDCELLADTEHLADRAAEIARDELDRLDAACSRFRSDSELVRLDHGTAVLVSDTLNGALAAGLRTARRTDGLVDLTVGRSMVALGYDDDLDLVRLRGACASQPQPAAGWWRISHDEKARAVLVPRGVELDLGASAKAWAVDRVAQRLGQQLPGRFLVNFGGDIAVSGAIPLHGWQVAIDDGDGRPSETWPVVTIHTGAVATSSTVARTWTSGDVVHHHVVDPRTGESAEPVWLSVTATARTCELANAATTAAIVLGTDAPRWLAQRRIHARLVGRGGAVVLTGDWPDDDATTVRHRTAAPA